MSASSNRRPLGRKPLIRPATPLPLRDVTPGMAAAARRPLAPTHEAATTNHARQHMPRHAQS
jgi:hypothetical protein